MARDIFISYSRKDFDKVKVIKEELEQATGAECWMDMDGISYDSSDFADVIVKAIDDAPVFIFMLSEHSQKSRIAIGEITLAQKKSKHIFIVNIDKCEMSDKFTILYSLHNFCDYSENNQKEKFLENLKNWTTDAKKNESTLRAEKEHQEKLKELENVKLIPFQQDGRYGFIDKGGCLIIPCLWKKTSKFSEGLAMVQDESYKWGFIDKTGKVVIPCQWTKAESFSEGLAKVEDDNGKYGFIDKTGNAIIPCQLQDAESFSEGLAGVIINSQWWGYIDKTGNLTIPCKWVLSGKFSEGLAKVMYFNQMWGYIDKTGKEVIHCQWESASHFKNGHACVRDSNYKWGFIDKSGTLVCPCMWSWVYDFSEGLAAVQDDNEKWGFIDLHGNVVIPCQWSSVYSFSDGLAKVRDSDEFRWWEIDKNGKVLGKIYVSE